MPRKTPVCPVVKCVHPECVADPILADTWRPTLGLPQRIIYTSYRQKKKFIFDLQDNRRAILADYVTEKLTKKTQWINIKSLDIPDNTSIKIWLKDIVHI